MVTNKVDILLPYWGDSALAIRTIDSVRRQTVDQWRLLVFDDCYPDKTVHDYIGTLNDSRIVYRRHRTNLGITKNFNFALRHAEAKYCVMLGCDDKLRPKYLETALMQINDADFYQPGVSVINKDDLPIYPLVDRIKSFLRPTRIGIHGGERLATSLCRGNWLYFPSIMWRTDWLKRYEFDEKYKVVEDVIVEISMVIDGAKLYLDNTVVFEYRRFADSVSSKEKGAQGSRFKEEAEAYTFLAEQLQKAGWKKASRTARLHMISRIHALMSK